MKKGEKVILAIALLALCMVTWDRILDLADPCFDSHTDTCVEALENGGNYEH